MLRLMALRRLITWRKSGEYVDRIDVVDDRVYWLLEHRTVKFYQRARLKSSEIFDILGLSQISRRLSQLVV